MSPKPTVYLLCGLPGSGKSTCARELEKSSAFRLTLDEELFKRFGREFESGYEEKERATKEELKMILLENMATGRSVILDYGFWKKAARDEYRELIEQRGGECKLLYFKVSSDELKKRLAFRNVTDQMNNHHIDETLLEKFIGEFEEPVGEGEILA